jgi:hypothetical protein
VPLPLFIRISSSFNQSKFSQSGIIYLYQLHAQDGMEVRDLQNIHVWDEAWLWALSVLQPKKFLGYFRAVREPKGSLHALIAAFYFLRMYSMPCCMSSQKLLQCRMVILQMMKSRDLVMVSTLSLLALVSKNRRESFPIHNTPNTFAAVICPLLMMKGSSWCHCRIQHTRTPAGKSST